MRLGNDAYGVSICEDIVERTGRDVSLGAVYKTLERLEAKGLVGEPDRGADGRARRAAQEALPLARRRASGAEAVARGRCAA